MKWLLIGSLISAVVLSATMTFADDHDRARELHVQGDILALETMLSRLPEEEGARVVGVELERERGRYVYEIERLEAGGIVREYIFDASTGELLKTEIED